MGVRWVVGFDEAGRGALAGPVVVGGWCWRLADELAALREGRVRDSKQMDSRMRALAYERLLEHSAGRGAVGFASARVINQRGIAAAVAAAAREAARRILPFLPQDPERVVVVCDGALAPPLSTPFSYTLIGADAWVPSVAYASVVAKVRRDRWMVRLARRYPAWGFAAHKGYATKQHCEAVRRIGLSPEHRSTFVRRLRGGENVVR